MTTDAIRDPIYGLIPLSGLEVAVINTPEFQRLRRIKQLAFSHLVYPSATHTRFEHSIGTLYVAKQTAECLRKYSEGEKKDTEGIFFDETGQENIRLAALLHDIGHPPFSHCGEQVLSRFIPDEEKGKFEKEEVHEYLTKRVIEERFRDLLGPDRVEEIVGILFGTNKVAVKNAIISGPLDVDKQDYLIRDSHHLGVAYGVFDRGKLRESLRGIVDTRGNDYLGVKEDAIYAVEQFILARYHIRNQVYRHKTRRLIDAMAIRAFELAIRDNVKEVIDVFVYENTDDYVERYLNTDDERLSSSILRSGTASLGVDLFKRIYSRDLLKEICRFNADDPLISATIKQNLDAATPKRVMEWESEVARKIKQPVEFVIIEKDNEKAPTFKRFSRRITIGEILIAEHPLKKLTDRSRIFTEQEVRDDFYINVYAPAECNDDLHETCKSIIMA